MGESWLVGRVREVYEKEQRKVAALEAESEKLRAALQARESALTQEKRDAEQQLLLGLCPSLACRVCLRAAYLSVPCLHCLCARAVGLESGLGQAT